MLATPTKSISILVTMLLWLASGTSTYGQLGWDWAFAEKCSLESQGNDVICDSLGNIYLTGYFGAQTFFGDQVYNAVGYHDYFVAKLNKDREMLWFRQGGIEDYNFGNGVVLDDSLNLYVSISLNNGAAALLQKYDSTGTLKWEKPVGPGYHWEHKGRVICFADDKIMAASKGVIKSFDSGGNRLDWFNMDATALSNYENGQFAAANEKSIVILDSGLTPKVTLPLPSSIDLTRALAIHNSEIYLSGRYTGTVSCGDDIYTGSNAMFIARMDQSGELVWFNHSVGSSYATGNSIVLNEYGDLFLAGYFRNTATFDTISLGRPGLFEEIFLAEYDRENGSLKDILQAGGEGDFDVPYGMCKSNDGQMVLTGSIKDSYRGVNFGDITVPTLSGNIDFFLAKTTLPEVKAKIHGQVFRDGQPIASRLKIFRIDQENNASKVYDVQSNAAGKFDLDISNKGTYLIKAHYYTESHIGTYYENAFTWDQSSELLIDSDTLFDSLRIDLISLPEKNGQNTISGSIYNATKEPERFIDLILVNEANNPVAHARSDTLGEYKFNSIPQGKYTILVDTTGLFMNSFYTVTITDFKSSLTDYPEFDFILRNGIIYTVNTTSASHEKYRPQPQIRIYPVPAREVLYIDFPKDAGIHARIDMLDIQGRLIKSYPSVESQIDVSGFPSGIYVLKIDIANTVIYRKIQLISSTK